MPKKIEVREGDTLTIRVRAGHVFGEDYGKQVVLMLPSGPQAVPLTCWTSSQWNGAITGRTARP